MDNTRNALAELAKRLRNGLYINPNDERFDSPVIVRTLDANDVLAAQRIVAELAKVQWWSSPTRELPKGEHLREVMINCRAIAEEGGVE